MAIFNNGINGGFSGKVGQVVGYALNGKWVMRSLPKTSKKNKKGSVGQNKYRSRFREVQAFLKPILSFIRVGFNLEGRAKMHSAHNAAKSYLLQHAFTAEGVFDYAKTLVTYGVLPGAESPSVYSDDIGFHFTWVAQPLTDWERNRDQVMLLAYQVEGQIAYELLSGARRPAQRETLEIPAYQKGKSFHLWLSFIADNRESIAMSQYLGEIVY